MGLKMTDFRMLTIQLVLLACRCWVNVKADCTGQVYECSLAEQANNEIQALGDFVESLYDEDAVNKGKSILNKKTMRKLGYGPYLFLCFVLSTRDRSLFGLKLLV